MSCATLKRFELICIVRDGQRRVVTSLEACQPVDYLMMYEPRRGCGYVGDSELSVSEGDTVTLNIDLSVRLRVRT